MSVEAETIIPVADSNAAMSVFVDHIVKDHDLSFDKTPDGAWVLQHDDFGLTFKPESRGLYVKISGPSANILVFFKESIAEHVGGIDATAAANIRWSGETAEVGDLPPNFKVLAVKQSRELFAGMQRVTLGHDDVGSLTADGVHLRMMMPLDPARTAVWPHMAANGAPAWPQGEDKLHARFITLRHVRPDDGAVDIDIVHHDGGLISDWATQATPGQTVGVMGPAGAAELKHETGLFLAADGTGIPAVARLMETASADATGDVVVAMPPGYDAASYFPETNLRLHPIAADRFEDDIVETATRLTAPGETAYAFFAGEFRNAQDLRRMFKQRLNLDKTTQISTAYWRRGAPGHGS